MFDSEAEVKKIRSWLRQWSKGFEAFVIGISGGIDSAVTAVICAGVRKTYGVMLPCFSSMESLKNAELLISSFNIVPVTVDLSSTHSELKRMIEAGIGTGLSLYPDSNMKSRLRAVALYSIAGQLGGVVIGTDNRCENYLGYFTKGGDGMVDCNPVGEYYKSEIYELARHLGIPEEIIQAAPTADLGISPDDETELGCTYPDIEKVMKHILSEKLLSDAELKALEPVFKRVTALHAATQHKRELPPTCPRT